MITTIAVIPAIAEKKKVQRSYGNHSLAIAGTTIAEIEHLYLSDCCRCDRRKVVSYDRYDRCFFLCDRSDHSCNGSDHVETRLFNLIMAYFERKDCLQRDLYKLCIIMIKP